MPVTEAAPLAAWGAAEPDVGWGRWYSWPRRLEAEKWAMDRGLIGDGILAYRIEFYLVDAPFARVYCFARNGAGHLFNHPATGRPALAEPVTIMLDDLPPAELLGPR